MSYELPRQLTRTRLNISQVIGIGMHVIGNCDNVIPVSNVVLSGTIHISGGNRKTGHYVAYIFQILVLLLL